MGWINKRSGRPKPWEARHRGPDGRERSRSFARKVDAQAWLDTQAVEILSGSWVDPAAGKVTLKAFADRWLEVQTFDASTREAVTSRLRVHVHPTLGDLELRAIRPSTVQAWVRGRQQQLAESYVRVLLANVSAILGAAVEDGLIVKNPCRSRAVRAPAIPEQKVVPWPVDRVHAVVAAHPEQWRGLPRVGAGCGLRQGEAFGLRVDDIDFLSRRLLVRRQIKLVGGKPVLAPPKGGRTREVPLPDVVAFELAERLRQWPAREVTLPWRDLAGDPVTAALVFTTRQGGPLNRPYFNAKIWKPALVAAGVEPSRANGMHALRHHYASVTLDGGVSIRALAEYLGHADPGFTLRTYAHLMPASEDRARAAIDSAHGPGAGQALAEGTDDA